MPSLLRRAKPSFGATEILALQIRLTLLGPLRDNTHVATILKSHVSVRSAKAASQVATSSLSQDISTTTRLTGLGPSQ
jgi:hypothetical protein